MMMMNKKYSPLSLLLLMSKSTTRMVQARLQLLRIADEPSNTNDRHGRVEEFGALHDTHDDVQDLYRALLEAQGSFSMSMSTSMSLEFPEMSMPFNEFSMSFGSMSMQFNDLPDVFEMTLRSPNAAQQLQVPIFTNPSVLSQCEPAYAHCPGISECKAGWSVSLLSVDWSRTLTCELFAGSDCSSELRVGTLTVSSEAVEWVLDSNYGATEFELYAGSCPISGVPAETGVCRETHDAFTLVADGFDPALPDFLVDATDDNLITGQWADYQLFPLDQHKHLVARATVCPCSLTGGCEEKTVAFKSNPATQTAERIPDTTSTTATESPNLAVFILGGLTLLVGAIAYRKRPSRGAELQPGSVASFSY